MGTNTFTLQNLIFFIIKFIFYCYSSEYLIKIFLNYSFYLNTYEQF